MSSEDDHGRPDLQGEQRCAPPEPPRGNREDELTTWLGERLGPGHLLGDDAAVLPPAAPGSRRVATVDSQIAGIHYPPDLDVRLAARRLLAVNLSDLAAMGAEPGHALLALSGPVGLDRKRYFEGLLAGCAEWGVTLAGGDLARTSEEVVASLTLLGELPKGRVALRRNAAQPGHGLWVSGALGESAAGRELLMRGATVEAQRGEWRVGLPPDLPAELAEAGNRAVWRHLTPTPELDLGRRLAESGAAGAVMDLSDGLGADLPRLCRASGVGAEIEAGALPFPPSFADLCAWLGVEPLEMALGGGEDYCLLITLPPDAPAPRGCTRIGSVRSGSDIVLLMDGQSQPLPATGWDHLERNDL